MRARPWSRLRVGVDIGGTFTDIVVIDEAGAIVTRKVSSTVDDYGRAIIEGLKEIFTASGSATRPEGLWPGGREVGSEGALVKEGIHATTIATNAILGLKGAKTGLITTKGFRDVLEIRRLRMPQLYNLAWEKPKPLVTRYLRLEVDERIDHWGEVVRSLDEKTVEAAIERLSRSDVESVAVCLINSYANPQHERRIGELLRKRSRGWHISLSSEILPEIKEYERTSTTVINAYVMPVTTTGRARVGSLKRGAAAGR